MDNRLGNSNGVGIPKKSRSLDLKTLYMSSISKDSVNKSFKRKNRVGDDGVGQKQDKKGRKVVSLSSFERVGFEGGESLVKVCNADIVLHHLEDVKVGLDDKLCDSKGFQCVSLGLGGSPVYVPKRRRGFVERSRFENGPVQKFAWESDKHGKLVDRVLKNVGEESSAPNQLSQAKEKGSDEEIKESYGASHLKLENVHASQCAVDGGKSVVNQRQWRRRKRKSSKLVNESVEEEAKHSDDNSSRIFRVQREDDEENLEANAARMLSSRFDTNCTQFPSISGTPGSPSVDMPLTAGKNSVNSCSKSFNSKCVSDDTDDRMLRPRRKHEGKSAIRKRRHFYEILFSDVKSNSLINKRIKVFWPLDESWYHGLVDGYDENKNMHHVKYDDRDEEWINLEGERFKILLFPTEVPRKNHPKRFHLGSNSSLRIEGNDPCNKDKEKQNAKVLDDSSFGNMEYEPIIAWLARSVHRFKSLSRKAVKTLKQSDIVTSYETVKMNGDIVSETVGQDKNRAVNSRASCESTVSGRNDQLKTTVFHRSSKLTIVYHRRRFHTKINRNCKGSVDSNFEVSKQHHLLEILDPDVDFWPGFLELYRPWNDAEQFGQSLGVLIAPLVNYFLIADVVWMSRVALLLRHGTLVTLLPRVCLEMLFLNNQDGLKYLYFEGCLTEALLWVFRVLTVVDHSDEQKAYADFQLPVSSFGFTLSYFPGLRRQVAFGFYSSFKVKQSKWIYLGQNVKRDSLIIRHLTLPECTDDNIKALQKEQPLNTSFSADSLLVKVMQKISRPGIRLDAVSGGLSFIKAWPSFVSYKKQSYMPPFLLLSPALLATLFLNLHLKMIMELDHNSANYLEPFSMVSEDGCYMEECARKHSESSLKRSIRDHAALHKFLCISNHDRQTCLSRSGIGSEIGSPTTVQADEPIITSSRAQDPENLPCLFQRKQLEPDSENCAPFSSTSVKHKPDTRSNLVNGISIRVPIFENSKNLRDREFQGTVQSNHLALNIQDSISIPKATARRSTWHRSRSSLFCNLSHGLSESNDSFLHPNFRYGPKKPRTRVSYSFPAGGSDSSNKCLLNKVFPSKRIRRSTERKTADVARGSLKDLEFASCDANVLVTLGDRGWREFGAQIFLEPFDNNEWNLAVKIAGTRKYSYKAHQFMQPRSTNRFTHAMMWKGGKEWTLEFPDRSQWSLFKEIHEECHNRNIRGASVRNIPIPGIRVIGIDNDDGTETEFTRCPSKYFRQTETDVEMALDPSRVLYDLDSDDEQWVSRIRKCPDDENSVSCEITWDMFEKAVDIFEKASYVKQRDHFTLIEIEELAAGGVRPLEAMKRIYEFWHIKRQKIGMPLIRHLQPPRWRIYQQQLKDWELARNEANIPVSCGSQENQTYIEKPAMFAFCLKPRGVEVQNSGSKHRSQKKLSIHAQQCTAFRDHEGVNTSAGRLSALRGERIYSNYGYEHLDESSVHPDCSGIYSPRDSGFPYFSTGGNKYYRNHHGKFQRNKTKKHGSFSYLGDTHTSPISKNRISGNINDRLNAGFSKWPSSNIYCYNPSQSLNLEELHGSESDEYKLRDAATAAKHALALAKLRRERADSLSYRADLAVQKAAAALMSAEVVSASYGDESVDGVDSLSEK